MFQHKDRVTYSMIKGWALDGYYDFCRDSGLIQRRSHEQIMGRVDYMFEDGFERPVENLMWQVVLLVLSGGWHSDWEVRARKHIAEQLAEYGLNNLMTGVPNEEADMFKHDLHVLGFV